VSIASTIEWTNASWNPVTGCTKVSAGCQNCYAERFAERFRGVPNHPFEQGFDIRLWDDRIGLPLKWKKPMFIFFGHAIRAPLVKTIIKPPVNEIMGISMVAMRETLDAVYRKGVFKPAKRPNLPEGKKVRITVESGRRPRKQDILELVARVLEGLSEEEIEQVGKATLDRRDFFGDSAS
jgi:predicted DNA-binding antitoxin AbrB/MazE fold protein